MGGYYAYDDGTMFLVLLYSLFITVGVYTAPIAIYRYWIKKEPIAPKKAKKITIIYGVCAFFVMSLLIFAINGEGAAGIAIVLWSYVNYRILTGGKAADPTAEENGGEETPLLIATENAEAIIERKSAQGEEIVAKSEEAPIAAEPTFASIGESPSAICEKEETKGEEAEVQQKLYCRKCGKQLPIDSNFCSSCGTAVIRSV